MPWLLDGNNLASGGDREKVRRAALDLARSERLRVVLLFDGAPPPGSPALERLGSVEVRYVPNADLAALALLAAGGRGWRLASSDRDLARQARHTGAEVVSREQFWSRIEALSGDAGSAREVRSASPGADGLEGVVRLRPEPRRVRRRPPGRRSG